MGARPGYQNIANETTLESPRQGGSYEYPQFFVSEQKQESKLQFLLKVVFYGDRNCMYVCIKKSSGVLQNLFLD